jgi:hypothetical protein
MESAMKKKERETRLAELENTLTVETRKSDLRRARSVTVGTAFGGTTEIMLRSNDGTITWAIMQPVEVVELIHQLAANVGCHIHLQPRNDFASWRQWKNTDEELKHYRYGGAALLSPGVGHPPHVNDMAPHHNRGAVLPSPEQQPGLQPAMMARSDQNEQIVATQKTVGRKRTKRAAAAA